MNILKKYIPNEIELLKKKLVRTKDWKQSALLHIQVNHLKKQMSNEFVSLTSDELECVKFLLKYADEAFFIYRVMEENNFGYQFFINKREALELLKTKEYIIKKLKIKIDRAASQAKHTLKTKQ